MRKSCITWIHQPCFKFGDIIMTLNHIDSTSYSMIWCWLILIQLAIVWYDVDSYQPGCWVTCINQCDNISRVWYDVEWLISISVIISLPLTSVIWCWLISTSVLWCWVQPVSDSYKPVWYHVEWLISTVVIWCFDLYHKLGNFCTWKYSWVKFSFK